MFARPTLEDTWNDNFRPRFGGNMDKKNQTEALPVNRAALAKSRAKMEAELRQKGLSTELDDSNKGFAMLQKMGYKKGAKRRFSPMLYCNTVLWFFNRRESREERRGGCNPRTDPLRGEEQPIRTRTRGVAEGT